MERGRNERGRTVRIALGMLALGAGLGALARWLDVHTTNLGNVFSECSVWVLIGVAVVRKSGTPLRAGGYLLALCGGMLAAYYGAAALTGGVYGGAYIAGWSLAALCVPAAAWVVWQAWRPGILGRCVGAGVIGAALLLSRVLFDGPRVYDWIIAAALAWLLFRRR